jgi:chromosome segregation protein
VKELQDLGYKEALQSTQEDVKEAQSALDIIKRELDDIGAVNQLALDSYEEQKNIYKQLSTRINELSEEKLSILTFMNELDRKKYDTFMTAFTNVNKNFQDIFTKISNGGSGRLLLENSEDPFKGGVDVYLRFPGKAELPISSASGGEKSVATVCFVIALQSIHPMPFYMFDEIDAHLDVLNTQRLADLLKERARGSQFIVISLRDITISRADRIYGIYIQNGVSHAVTLPMPEAKA